jgi:D-threonine aldolase
MATFGIPILIPEKNDAMQPLEQMCDRLEAADIAVPEIVAGGTPTFPVHALRQGVMLSPGTCVLWDGGYERLLPDLDFLHAAVVLTRVISKPAPDRLCLDLGHKSIAAENPHPRVYFLGMEDVEFLGQSEEHLVLSCARRDEWAVGKEVYGIPHHICPTTALYEAVHVVSERQVVDSWRVIARDRSIGA